MAPEQPQQNNQQQQGFNLFGAQKKPQQQNGTNLAEIAGELNNVSRRLRLLEERYSGMRHKSQVMEQNMLKNNKDIKKDVRVMSEQLDDFHREINSLKDNFKIMISEIKECAKRDDVKILQKYIDMWEPIQFVTRREMIKLIRDNVESQFDDLNIRLQQEDYIKEQIKLQLEDYKK